MQHYEYRAVPAPAKSAKVKGLKDPAERYAHALSALMNDMALEGWEYWRAEVLPCIERKGLTGSVTVYHNLLVFRRLTADALAAQMAHASAAPPAAAPPAATEDAAAAELPSMPSARADADPATEPAENPAPARPLLSRIPEGSSPRLVLRRDTDRPVSPPADRSDG